MTNKNIILVGFMGSGKSLCSNKLGDMLNREVISTDAEVERREMKSIPEIFEEKGEAYFRKTESQVVKDISTMPDKIIDTGGGVVLNTENINILKESGMIIWLKATPEEIWENVNKVKRNRPLLDVENPQEKIKELLEERIPFYSQADISIHSGTRPIEDVCNDIINLVS